MTNKTLLAIDPGNGFVKARLNGSKQIFSSMVMVQGDDIAAFEKIIKPQRSQKQGAFLITVDGKTYTIGTSNPSDIAARMLGKAKYQDKMWSTVIPAATLSRFPALLKTEHPVHVGVTVPYAWLLKDDGEFEALIVKAFRGTHTFTLEKGQERSITVKSVKVFGEGLAGYFKFATNNDRAFKTQYDDRSTLVMDIGRGTINAFVITGQSVNPRFVFAEMWGTDLLLSKIGQALGDEVSLDRIEQAIREGKNKIPGYPNFSSTAKPVVTEYADKLTTYAKSIESRFGNPIPRVLVMGGGPLMLGDLLTNRLQDGFTNIVVGNEFSNVDGLYKMIGGEVWEDEHDS